MGLDHPCNTCLVLGLGFPSTSSNDNINIHRTPKELTTPDLDPVAVAATAGNEPSLTLSLSGAENYNYGHQVLVTNKGNTHQVSSKRNIKREEADVERVSSRVSDEEADGIAVNVRKKLRLTKEQHALLEESFKQHSNLNPKRKQALARELNVQPRQVEVWFQNRRARTKLKQTEVDREFLKNRCETLKRENKRLQKEIQELKAMTLVQHFYMHVCPSCGKVGGSGGGGAATKGSSPVAPRPLDHFFCHFPGRSAAC